MIAGLQSKRYAGTPDASFNFFDITPYGLPYGVWGFVYVLLIGVYLLPKDTGSRPKEDLLLAAEVAPNATQVGFRLEFSKMHAARTGSAWYQASSLLHSIPSPCADVS